MLANKGATEQHSYIQQSREELNDFLAVFIEVLNIGRSSLLSVEFNLTSGDFRIFLFRHEAGIYQ